MMLLVNLSIIAVVWFGGIRIDKGNMQVGDLIAFIQYLTQIMFALMMLSMMFVMVPRASASADRINEILRKKIIDTYYTYKQEYMPDTEDEPEIEDEFDDIDINEFEKILGKLKKKWGI